MVNSYQNGLESSRDSIQVELFHKILNWELKSISITDGLMIKIRLFVVKRTYKLFLSYQMKYKVRFLVIFFSKTLFSTSLNFLNFQKKGIFVIRKKNYAGRKSHIVSSPGMIFSIKISWFQFWDHLNQENVNLERLFTLNWMKWMK